MKFGMTKPCGANPVVMLLCCIMGEVEGCPNLYQPGYLSQGTSIYQNGMACDVRGSVRSQQENGPDQVRSFRPLVQAARKSRPALSSPRHSTHAD